MKRLFLYLFAAVVVPSLTACAGMGDNTIHVEESRKSSADAPRSLTGVTIRIAGYQDARPLGHPRRIGVAEGYVGGLSGKEIMLDRDATEVVANSVHKRLDDAGIQVLAKDDSNALFELSGVIREMRYDVRERDYVQIRLETSLKDVVSGKVIWVGEVEQKSDRFAGVSGSSRRDIAEYLKKELGIVSGKTSEAVSSLLMAMRPELFNLTPGTKAISGVTVLVAPGVTSPAPAPVPGATESSQVAMTGGLVVTTDPVRAKIYLDGVYYGVSPLRIESSPGVHTVEAKLKGYKSAAEKVSIRQGVNTELDLPLEQ